MIGTSGETETVVDVIGLDEVIAGVCFAVGLAVTLSWLRGASSSSFPNLVLWSNSKDNADTAGAEDVATESITEIDASEKVPPIESQGIEENLMTTVTKTDVLRGSELEKNEKNAAQQGGKTVFDSWKEMSRPENYVYYMTRIRNRIVNKTKKNQSPAWLASSTTTGGKEKKWVALALVLFFVPIFSIEFFFALSRQFMCGNGDWFSSQTQSSGWAQFLCSPHR